ncbi:MAG: hypothetical protein KY453_04035 [Gemmatimonadetes bacterium]|nr:hypothetical protein [Gemmatimonadota bacterium]
MARPTSCRLAALLLAFALSLPVSIHAQTPARIVAEPAAVAMVKGEDATVRIRVVDATGRPLEAPLRVGASRRALDVQDGGDGTVRLGAIEVGEHQLVVSTVQPGADGRPVTVAIPVRVAWPAVARVEVEAEEGRLYAGTRLAHRARVVHVDGSERPLPRVTWRSWDPSVADVDAFGNVNARGPGTVRIEASFEGSRGTLEHRVEALPVAAVDLRGGRAEIRTGDVQEFEAVARDRSGRPVADAPVTWSLLYAADDSIKGAAAPGQLDGGRFVADVPGVYTVIASVGPHRDESSFRVTKRDVVREVEVVGQGRLDYVYTTDFWVFEGVDGRDYALTGSKTDGKAFVFDVTDPGGIVKTDSIMVDARSVNDVKVSPDGRWGAISREGASNRRNGVVILDLADPAHPVVAATYDQGLTGGVHNMYATETHLFALSAGDKYVILDMSELSAPRYVSEYDHPDSRVHDVWVHDGLAYSAEWGTGVVVVDVGNGRWGGTIEEPVFVTSYPLPSGGTHAVFPYRSESTDKFYLVVGDEILNREGKAWQGNGPDFRQQYDPETGMGGYPRATSGYVQIVDFTDPESPDMVARYEVPEFGTHNMWVEDDVLYQAYYEGGMRMVDMSGELMGNLYTQDREIAVFKAHDPAGFIPNSPGAWSVMPYKGHVFFSDINSGLWAVKVEPDRRPVS